MSSVHQLSLLAPDAISTSPPSAPEALTELEHLPRGDNTTDALAHLRRLNRMLRQQAWPVPFDRTHHVLRRADARDLTWVPDQSVHLVVTSPPYWTLKRYNDAEGQLGAVEDYEHFLDELDRVWKHCARVLAPGGRVCCVVGDVCIPRRLAGKHMVMPLHADIQVRMRQFGLDNLSPIHWYKISNARTEAAGNGAGYYGKPYQPGAVVKNDVEYILFFRKGSGYRAPSPLQKALSMLSRAEMQQWFRAVWTDLPGASTRAHPAPYPVELAVRLIRMFSFAGDIVLDPFSGTATTTVAAIRTGRNSISCEVDPAYFEQAVRRVLGEADIDRSVGARLVEVAHDSILAQSRIGDE